VPRVFSHHEGDSVSLDGFADYGTGLVDNLMGILHSLQNLGDIVPVDGLDMPAESLPLILDRIGTGYFTYGSTALVVVVVDENGQVAYLVMAGGHRCLPNHALPQFPVSGDGIDLVCFLANPGSQGHPQTDGYSVAQ